MLQIYKADANNFFTQISNIKTSSTWDYEWWLPSFFYKHCISNSQAILNRQRELFTKLGVVPWGRIGTGVIELIASILLLIPATIFIGALLGIGLISGAILSHLTIIGVEFKGDSGQIFMLAIAVWFCCAIIMLLNKQRGIALIRKFRKTNLSINL